MGYTLAQVDWWAAAVAREKGQDRAAAILAVRLVWANGKLIDHVLKALGVG